MKLIDALDEVLKKEEEGRLRLQTASRKADDIRYEGEEEATKLYRKLRGGMKNQTSDYRAKWKRRLELLENKLKKERRTEAERLKQTAAKKQKKASQDAYRFLVGQL
jgi:F0F1-type ATP synthase membrane subunit b/b'